MGGTTRQPRGPPAVLAAVAIVLLAATLQPAAAQAPPAAALAPLDVALGVLPESVRLAIAEAEEQLRSDQAQQRLQQASDYVQGFAELPPSQGALADPALREAYGWTGQVVESFLAVPAELDRQETAGAICRSYGANATQQQARTAVADSSQGSAALAALRADVASLRAHAPAGLDLSPVDEALATLDAWTSTEGQSIVDCVGTLPVDQAPDTRLEAFVLPTHTYPTGSVRVIGTVEGAETVRATSTALRLDASATAVNGTFRIPFTVPRATALGTQVITVTAGNLRARANLTVAKAPVSLQVQAPPRVVANATFTIRVSASSPAGSTEVDRAAVQLTWRSAATSVPLHTGSGQASLPAGPAANLVLHATYPGTDILAPASFDVPIQVFVPGGANDALARGLPTPHALPTSLLWWLVVGVAGVALTLALFLAPVALHQLRGATGGAVRGKPSPARWPGATTFTMAMGDLFDLLRRRRLVAPGLTVREWVQETGETEVIADRFEAVRYGGMAEDEALRSTGVSWARRAWDRWRQQ